MSSLLRLPALSLGAKFGAALALAFALVAGGGMSLLAGATSELRAPGGTDSATGGSGGIGSAANPGVFPSKDANGGSTSGDRVDLVQTGYFALEVDDLDARLAAISSAIEAKGGYVSSSARYGDASNPSLNVTFRIPATAFTAATTTVRGEGTVLQEEISSYEVTMQLVDLEARLKNLRASESALIKLMAKATRIADVLSVQSELSRVRGDIESYDAQRAALADQVAMATISVQLTLPASPLNTASKDFNLVKEIQSALANLVAVGRSAIVLVINLVVVALPIVLIGALLGGLLGRAMTPLVATVRSLLAGGGAKRRGRARR